MKKFPFDSFLVNKEELEKLVNKNHKDLTASDIGRIMITLRGAFAYINQLEEKTK